MFWGLWTMLGPWSLLLLLPSLWATWDYVRRGGMVDEVDKVFLVEATIPSLWKEDAARRIRKQTKSSRRQRAQLRISSDGREAS